MRTPAFFMGASCLLPIVVLSGCLPRAGSPSLRGAAPAAHSVRFTDVTDAAGIHFRHTNGRSGRLYLPETLGSGCAFLDYNHDGKLDLFLVNSSRLPGFAGKGPFYPALYRNNGAPGPGPHRPTPTAGVGAPPSAPPAFTDVTKEAGLAIDCYGMGVAIADYDGDGYEDLYLTAMGPNHLFHNNGNGTFTDVTEKAGVGDPRFSTSAAWLDYDRDGNLDLFVCNYARWEPAVNKLCPDAFHRNHICGPTYYKGQSSTLYHNNGDGTFTDVTKRTGLYEPAGKALGVLVGDFNDDGWPDLLLARDMEPNLLYQNNRNGTFTERGVEAGIAYSTQGQVRAGMGIDTGDTTNEGRESVLIGNNTAQGLAQYLPDVHGHFTDVADQTGLFEPSLQYLTFGLAMVDYDGDGCKDIIVANGHVDENVRLIGDGHVYEEPIVAFHNDGRGRFREAGNELGPAFAEKRVWRGLAVGDFDNDGDPDLLVSTCNGKPALLRNDGGNQNHWLQVKAIAAGRNRDGIGTRVTVTANGAPQTGWIRSGSSYCSQSELKAFFGLGSAAQAEQVELRFQDGARQTVLQVKADQMIVVQEGKGLVAQGAPGAGEMRPLPPLRRGVAAR